ncbi:MAG: AraC family transcriptional regulator [Paenibacillus sp.]|nr:AraC family transcriptional regulator [Paenibacillus sp.]
MIESALHSFPILLRSNEWLGGTNFHHQPGLEIHITHEGSGTMVAGKQVLLQTPRSVVVFRGTMPHQMISKSTYKRTVICIDLDDSKRAELPAFYQLIDFSWIPEDSCVSFSLTPKQFQTVEERLRLMRQEFQDKPIGWQRMVMSQVLELTVLLQRSIPEAEEHDEASASSASGKKSELVQACSDYICSHLGEDLALRTVARRFAVSEEHLTRCFTKEMGISFYQYVLLQRVVEGKRLLQEAVDIPISEIAFMTGFPSSSQFSHHFKALTEETPSGYRQRVNRTNRSK